MNQITHFAALFLLLVLSASTQANASAAPLSVKMEEQSQVEDLKPGVKQRVCLPTLVSFLSISIDSCGPGSTFFSFTVEINACRRFIIRQPVRSNCAPAGHTIVLRDSVFSCFSNNARNCDTQPTDAAARVCGMAVAASCVGA